LIAGAVALLFQPHGAVLVALVALCAWAAFALFPASHMVGLAWITTLIVFLFQAIASDTFEIAGARLVDTLSERRSG
jgi:uncharacterized membrane protein YccC